MNGGEAVAEVLRRAGVGHVFGLLGGSMLELYDALYRQGDIGYVGARDERAAAHMADAYARINGGPGVVLGAQAGPGAANLTTGLAEALLAYSPLVAIAGMITRDHQGRDTFQEIDQQALFAPVSKRSFVVPKAERLPEMLAEALRLAMSGRRGPVVLNVPRDLFAAEVALADDVVPAAPAVAGVPDAAGLERLLALLAAAKAPVLCAGGGIKWSRGAAALARLAEDLDIPVAASAGHADVLPHDHPLFAGQQGPARQPAGQPPDPRGRPLDRARHAPRLQLHLPQPRPCDGRRAPSSRSISRRPPSAAISRPPWAWSPMPKRRPKRCEPPPRRAAWTGAGWRAWSDRFRSERAALSAERDAEAAPGGPSAVAAPGLRRATSGSAPRRHRHPGHRCHVPAGRRDRLAHYRTPGLITPLDFGLVGFGYAAALGAATAAPDRPVVAVLGDGGFGITLAEVTTAVQHGLKVVAVVLDNGAWGAEKAYQRDFFGARFLGADLVNPPFDEVARLCGAAGYAANAPGETAAALAAALDGDQPAVIHVKVDPDAMQSLRKDLFKPPPKAGS